MKLTINLCTPSFNERATQRLRDHAAKIAHEEMIEAEKEWLRNERAVIAASYTPQPNAHVE